MGPRLRGDDGTGAKGTFMTHEYLDLQTVSHVEGAVRLPGSKSISSRRLRLAEL